MNNRIKKLESEIRFHNHLYWDENEIAIDDRKYDELVNELKLLDPTNDLINKVHSSVKSDDKVHHNIPMLSMEKVYNYEDLLKWCTKVSRSTREIFRVEPKYDGVSGDFTDGVLSTRGDGFIGENVTDKLPLIEIVGSNIDTQNVRGEIIFTKSNFKKNRDIVLRKDGSKYKNERNAVGGILNRDDIDSKIGNILTMVDFNIPFYKFTLNEIIEGEKNGTLKSVEGVILNEDYPADGIVFKIDDENYAKSLGSTSHHLKSAMALKFVNPFGFSKLIKIIWSVGKHTITPIGRVEEVEVNDIIIKNVNLHNMKNIRDMDIHIGDTLKIERAGDVIPFATKVIPGKERTFIVITACPSCGHDVIYKDPEIVCSNPDCPGKHLMRLMDSVTRIGIERLGQPTLQKMVSTSGVYNLIDIFNLSREDIIKMDGFAESSTENLLIEIQTVKKTGVFEWQILSSLNLQGIGRSLSKDLLKDITLEELRTYSTYQLKLTEGIGEERAKVLYDGLIKEEKYIDDLLKILPIKERNIEEKGDRMKICFTGKFPEKKSYYYDLVQDKYEIVEKVTKDLDILVVADTSKVSSKQIKAAEKGIKIMSIKDLLEIK